MAGNSNDDDATAYRNAQIEFVSNNNGTTARETMLLLLPCVCSLYMILTTITLIGKSMNTIVRFIFEFISVVLTSILCFTSHIDKKPTYCLTMLGISSINFFIIAIRTDASNIGINSSSKKTNDKTMDRLCPSLTNFRALTSLLTAICILGVDFKVFPRGLAKTEIYGYSLMDTGVGFFILSNALVSREARAVDDHRESGIKLIKITIKNVIRSLRDCVPLLILGFARYFSIEYLEYQRHVTEYGIHWNFFATLASVKIFTSIFSSLVTPRLSLLLGILFLSTYEYFLSYTSFGDWVLNGSRDNFLSSNREGISSTFGYVGLYFIGVAIGRLIHSTYRRDEKEKEKEKFNIRIEGFNGRIIEAQYSATMILCVKLSVITAQACVATRFLESYFSVSRKLANAGYCAWMITLTATLITILILLDVLADILRQLLSARNDINLNDISSTPEILKAINYNGLAFFLICNFLTGVINMTVKTLYVDNYLAVAIITGYMFVATSLFTILYKYKIQLKF